VRACRRPARARAWLLAYLDEEQDAQETQRLVKAYDRRCELIHGDVGDPAFCREVVDQALDTCGGVNILVNNAAEQYDWNDITEIPDDQLLRTFEARRPAQRNRPSLRLPGV
jgi:NAD(P)-dependent dehydrogenase (short-subunit alcohol dehydrogenase family)